MLKECRRVLAPGGRIRIATPDLPKVAGLTHAPDGGIEEEYLRWITESFVPDAEGPLPAYAINQLFRGWRHRFLYDRETLAAVLERVGFSGLTEHAPGHNDDPASPV